MSDKPFTFLPLGALIKEFKIDGKNIVLNFHNEEQYKKYNAPFFGETIGRVANRISGAKINSLNGKSYQLADNNNGNALHGGPNGWGKLAFEGPIPVESDGPEKEKVLFKYTSPDGDEGYPGTVELKVWYTQWTEKSDGRNVVVLDIEYEAQLVGDEDVQETVINVTNHSYFNLTDGPTIEGTDVTLATSKYQVVDNLGIPIGPIDDYPGIKGKEPFNLGPQEPDIDDCFVLNTDPSSVPIDTRPLPLQELIYAHCPATDINLEVLSTEPAFQFYTGRFIETQAVDDLPARGKRAGFCLEPSRYVNAVNVEEYKSMVLLKRGEKYGSRIVYRGWKGGKK
ncbi:putative aldose 1-epimerase [Patellaria atrata CBS 101060]|uniref:Aldose 1-epimerase n=1 Tax=Patellaria atrata CBS 101060 TaxID=1346257 RepID=A0A9P4S573_9PEZI|nr:putative aldose 1-epimerase [Patellaria atrata CBS 101060]